MVVTGPELCHRNKGLASGGLPKGLCPSAWMLGRLLHQDPVLPRLPLASCGLPACPSRPLHTATPSAFHALASEHTADSGCLPEHPSHPFLTAAHLSSGPGAPTPPRLEQALLPPGPVLGPQLCQPPVERRNRKSGPCYPRNRKPESGVRPSWPAASGRPPGWGSLPQGLRLRPLGSERWDDGQRVCGLHCGTGGGRVGRVWCEASVAGQVRLCAGCEAHTCPGPPAALSRHGSDSPSCLRMLGFPGQVSTGPLPFRFPLKGLQTSQQPQVPQDTSCQRRDVILLGLLCPASASGGVGSCRAARGHGCFFWAFLLCSL